MYKILVLNKDKEIIKTFNFTKKVDIISAPMPAAFVEISAKNIKKLKKNVKQKYRENIFKKWKKILNLWQNEEQIVKKGQDNIGKRKKMKY